MYHRHFLLPYTHRQMFAPAEPLAAEKTEKRNKSAHSG
jgi:hypothetical protein